MSNTYLCDTCANRGSSALWVNHCCERMGYVGPKVVLADGDERPPCEICRGYEPKERP